MKYEFEKMLSDFAPIKNRIIKDPTFLEISGYPHYENVCSNILAFFLDPQKEHGLADLLLQSIFQSLGHEYNLDEISNVKVEREVEAGAARVDLVIESDSHVVAIENKIYHNADGNPFEAYAYTASALASVKKIRHENVILILLCLDEKTIQSRATLAGFKCICYRELFAKIRLNMGNYITDANNKYLIFFLEFMRTMENLYGGNIMDNQLVKFFEKYQDEAQDFYLAFNNFRDHLRNMVIELQNRMNIDAQERKIKQIFYRESGQLRDALVYDIVVNENLTIVVDCEIAPYGWEIDIYARKGDIGMVEELLKKNECPFEIIDAGKMKYKIYNYNEPIENILKDYEGIINKILGS